MKRIFLFVIPFLFFSAAFLSEGADEVIQKLNEHLARYPQEKAYIHFDKPYYSVGETIWFKAYLLGAEKSNPQALSSLIRAELIDPNNKIISKRELKVTQGGAAGDFLLPETLDPGKYTVRAYTNWMRNFDNDYFFRKSFEVVKTYVSDSLQEVSSPAGGKLNMKFFPEGGDLVSGLASIVGFKVVDENGLGVNVIGEILDTSGTSLTTFESSFVGIGKFLLKPQYGINYYARISINGKSQEFQLPDTKQEGCIMRVNNGYKSDKVTVAITSNGVNLTSGFVIGHQNGNVFSKIVNKGLKSSFGIGLDSEIFPSGICHLTFFDASGTALTERIVLVKHEPVRVKVEMEADREVYETRQLAALKLKLTTADSSDVLGNVSVSITPKEIITYTANYQNIKNYLLLSSDLKGYIEQPEYYFQQSEESFRALDNLMLTQGWRRFTWKSVLSDSGIQSQFLAEDGITVSGQLFDLYAIEKPRSGRVSMSIFDGTFNYLEGETDDDGKFIFASLDFEDSTDLMIQGERIIGKKGKSDDNVFIKLDPVTEPIVDAEFISETPFQTKLDANYLSEKKKIEKIDRAFDLDKEAIILDAVEIFSRKDYSNDPFRSRTQYYSEPSARLAFDSLPAANTALSVYDLIRGRVAGVTVSGRFPNYTALVRGIRSMSGGNAPLYLLDGTFVNAGVINSINPLDVLFVDILKGADAALFGSRGANGAIAVYTRREPAKEVASKSGALNMTHPGYYRAREFYTPDYQVVRDEHAKPDVRSTLYWNPTVFTDTAGMDPLVFYTSDQKGEFDVSIEGITMNGDPIFFRETLVVK